MGFTFFQGLSQNFSQLLDNGDDYDTIIESNTKKFRVHSIILKARSPYFKKVHLQNDIKRKDGMIIHDKPNISPTVFEMVIR